MSQVVRPRKPPKVRCSICLELLFDQEIGIPDCCQHTFCFACLANWTKQGHLTCPLDRIPFQHIFKKHSITSRKPFAKVKSNNVDLEIPLEEEENIKILSCGICESEEQDYHPLLTCVGCSQSFHEFCLNSFNTFKWICPSCEYSNEERPEVHLQHADRRKESHTSQGNHANATSTRSVITPKEAANRLAASGLSVVSDPRAAVLKNQAQYMSELQQKRKLVARLPPKIPINKLPRIQRRSDAPLRPQSKTIIRKSKASFLDKLLHSQHQLRTLENIQIQGAHIKLS